MSIFSEGIQTRADAIRLLRHIDGQKVLETSPWDIDDFASVPHSNPAIDRCRLRVRDELIDLLSSQDQAKRKRIPSIIAEMINELEQDAHD